MNNLILYAILIFVLCILLIKVFNLFFDFINLLRGYSPNLPSNALFRKNLFQIYQFKSGQKVADFGCGGGKLIDLLKKYPVKITGVELNPLVALITKIKYSLNSNINIIHGDLLDQRLENYDVILIYAVPDVMNKLESRILSEKPKNLTIISNRFKFENLKCKQELPNTYLYEINYSS